MKQRVGHSRRSTYRQTEENLQTEAVENTAIPDNKIKRILWTIVNGGNELKILGNIHEDRE